MLLNYLCFTNFFFINRTTVSNISGRQSIKKPIGLKRRCLITDVRISMGLNENKFRIKYKNTAEPNTIRKLFDFREETKRIINNKKIRESANSI
ncbi:MAG: hypothetical protein V3V33_15005 [Candidatus Lokiarchaeia archaeon]